MEAGAFEEPALLGRKAVAAVRDRSVIPNYDIVGAPFVAVGKFGPLCPGDQPIERRFGFRQVHVADRRLPLGVIRDRIRTSPVRPKLEGQRP